MSLREEIQDICERSGHDDAYMPYTAAMDILEKIEKRINELRKKHPRDLYGAYNAGLDDVIDDMLNENK